MNLKSLLFSMSLIATAPVFAATYYVTPDGAGTKDGSSWDNAFDVEAFRTQALANADGDVYNFGGGSYRPSATIIFKKSTYAILNGNVDGDRTIFTGAKNDTYATRLDRLMRFQTVTGVGNLTKPVEINDIDFTGVYTNSSTDPTNDDKSTGVAGIGALYIDNSGCVTVSGCNFYNNWAEGKLGGAAVQCHRSTVKFVNCVFRNNSATYAGGAVRLRTDNAAKGITTFENCVFKGNTNYHNGGGAILFSSGNALNIINCTMFGNKAVSEGAAIYIDNDAAKNSPRKVNIVNSTIAGNSITGENVKDAQITAAQTVNIAIANSIVASKAENTADFYFAGSANPAVSFVSGGFNYVGSIIDEAANDIAWQETDNHGDECTYTAIFGENTLNSDNVIIPANFYLGATGAQVSDAVASWGLPADLDLAVDQLGNTRNGECTPGAYACAKPGDTTGIDEITGNADAARIVALGGGLYQIEGYEGAVGVYGISGINVMTTNGSTVDLSSMAAGLYIIKAGNTIFKVKK